MFLMIFSSFYESFLCFLEFEAVFGIESSEEFSLEELFTVGLYLTLL